MLITFSVSKLYLRLAVIGLCILAGVTLLEIRKAAISLANTAIEAHALIAEARTQMAVNGSEAHRVLLEAGLTAREARLASTEQRKFWSSELPRLASKSEGAVDHIDALVDSLRHTSDGLGEDSRQITAAVTDTTNTLKPVLIETAHTAAAATDVARQASQDLSDPSINATLKEIHVSAQAFAGTAQHVEAISSNLDHKVDSYLHPGFWGKLEGYTLFGFELFKDIVETKSAFSPISVRVSPAAKAEDHPSR